MKKVKKLVSIILVFLLMISMISVAPITTSAQTGGHTQAEAVAWAQAQVGKALDYDGVYGAQCVDLIAFYYRYLGNTTPGGNARDYCSNALPSGWKRITNSSGFVPQPGDICVWGANAGGNGSYGHVAIYINGNSSRINTVDQNYLNNQKTDYHFWNTAQVTCFIRPDFSPPTGNNPEGTLDIVSSDKPGRIFIRGWAFDRDNLNAALSIHVYIGKQEPNLDPNCELHTIVANTERSDLDDMFHVGKNHGFCAYIDTSLTGDYNVYVYAINIGSGSNAIIGQKAVTIQTPYSPEGTLDIVTANVPGKVFVRGWAFDRDDLEQSISIHVYIGQQEPNKDSNCEFHAIKADSERTDLDDMFHVGKNHGFSSYIDTQKTGSQNVYVYAINIGGGGNAFIGSRSVTITTATETQSTQITESATDKPTNPKVTETVTTTPTVPTTSPITTNPTQTKPTVISPNTTNPTENKTTVSLAKYSANIYVRGTTTIKPTVKNGKGVTTYKSNNTRVAKVDSGGKLTALKAGTAKITITNNKVSKVFTVKVLNPKLNKTSVSISRGKSYTLKITGKIGTAKFYTSNKKIATVNSKGKIKVNKKAKKGKTVIIKVKTNGITLKCKVKVK